MNKTVIENGSVHNPNRHEPDSFVLFTRIKSDRIVTCGFLMKLIPGFATETVRCNERITIK